MTPVSEIHLQPEPIFPGAERAGCYRVPEYLRQFSKTHAIITFSEPVVGPLVIGAGRYIGLGLMAGLDEQE
jgi:CRISPR-associated protein Csb2